MEEQQDIELGKCAKEFECCVCWELLHKPVVLGCGHALCFWCNFKWMSNFKESKCPNCSLEYNYLPGVCGLMHFLLQKLYPADFSRLEKKIIEEEKNSEFCLPPIQNLNSASCASGLENGTYPGICASEFLCHTCNKLLFRPVVLKCGHVYCQSCIPEGEIIMCQICLDKHPHGVPSVCLVLDDFIKWQYPKAYAQQQQLNVHGPSGSRPSLSNLFEYWKGDSDVAPQVHFGIGCDQCGMSPIVGDRFKCKDCRDKMGFDLCKACHEAPSGIHGRFGQQHKPEHKMENVQLDEYGAEIDA